jgi:hypothetical protein
MKKDIFSFFKEAFEQLISVMREVNETFDSQYIKVD